MNCVADAGFSAQEFFSLEALTPGARALFGRAGIFSTLGWYRSTQDCALPSGSRAVFVVIARGAETFALFPMLQGPGKVFAALTTPYTCLWSPLFADTASANMVAIGRAFAVPCRRFATVRLDAMDGEAPWLQPLLDGLRHAGIHPQRFDHFGNWHEPVAGIGWETYLAARPGALRAAIRRRGKKLIETMGARMSVIRGTEGLEPAITAYEKIYAASWKQPEPFASFNAAFMRVCATDGSLRLGILTLGDAALAAQFWVVRDGWAGVLKLAHDEASRALSPGTVLTAFMIRDLLKHDHVTALDFGRGDDGYKQDWVSKRRQRVGFVLVNTRLFSGAVILACSFLKKRTKKLLRLWRASPDRTATAR